MATKLQFQIPEWTSIEDVAQWDCEAGDDVEFLIKRESAFQLFTTGAAISAVQRIRFKASNISIRCQFAFPREDIRGLTLQHWPDFFLRLGGVALLRAANQVVDAAGTDLSTAAFDAMWRRILLKSGGVIGDGKSQNLVCREFDSPIPEAIRSSETNRFPSRQEFESVLGRLGNDLGAGKKFFSSVTEVAVSSFLFETFRNSIEHAIPTAEGVWGVVIEKMIFQSLDEVSRRQQLPEFARSFVERRFKKRAALWICVTVADYGAGIQNTLPAMSDETEWTRLLRAFERGASKKPQSGSPERGQGLPNILDAAGRLDACVFVNSTGIAAINENSNGQSWSQLAIPAGLIGTSISVLWPISDETPDQDVLNLGL